MSSLSPAFHHRPSSIVHPLPAKLVRRKIFRPKCHNTKRCLMPADPIESVAARARVRKTGCITGRWQAVRERNPVRIGQGNLLLHRVGRSRERELRQRRIPCERGRSTARAVGDALTARSGLRSTRPLLRWYRPQCQGPMIPVAGGKSWTQVTTWPRSSTRRPLARR